MKNYKYIRKELYVLKLPPLYFFFFLLITFTHAVPLLADMSLKNVVIVCSLTITTHITLYFIARKKRNSYILSSLPRTINNAPNHVK